MDDTDNDISRLRITTSVRLTECVSDGYNYFTGPGIEP